MKIEAYDHNALLINTKLNFRKRRENFILISVGVKKKKLIKLSIDLGIEILEDSNNSK